MTSLSSVEVASMGHSAEDDPPPRGVTWGREVAKVDVHSGPSSSVGGELGDLCINHPRASWNFLAHFLGTKLFPSPF